MRRCAGMCATAFLVTAIVVAGAYAAAPDGEPPPAAPPTVSVTPNFPPVPADLQVEGRPLRDILNSAQYLERLVTHLIGYETWIGLCSDAEPLSRKRTWVVGDPVALPGAETIEELEWMEIIELSGCGRTYERTVFATYANGKPTFHVRLPGSSRAEPVVQHAAITALRTRESEASWRAGCDRADHARIIGGELDESWTASAPGAWREVWAVHTCAGVIHVPVTFAPGESGDISFTFDDH